MDNIDLATGLVVDFLGNTSLLQKKFYIAQELGLNLGYGYRWYPGGPYSEALSFYLRTTLNKFFKIKEKPVLNNECINVLRKVQILTQEDYGLEREEWCKLLSAVMYFENPTEKETVLTVLKVNPAFNKSQVKNAYVAYKTAQKSLKSQQERK